LPNIDNLPLSMKQQERQMIMSETAEEKPVLQLNRVTAAARERVFTAWTTLDAIKVWFEPEDCRVLVAQVDLRVGGETLLFPLHPEIG
jgi:uncharacterized protein YndB with AHSA1/START domain